MAVIRVQKTENYTVMSNHHLRNRKLSLKAKGLMSLMLSLPPEWDYSVGGLAAICKEGATAVRSALKELEENQYLIRERKNSEKGYFVYEYTLYEIPISSYTENRQAGDTHADSLHAENRTQINKDKLTTNKLNKNKINKDNKNETAGVEVFVFPEILNQINDIELRNLYVHYVEMRTTIKSPMTKRSLSMLINRCERLSNFDIELQKEMLEEAIINNWRSVYAPKEEKPQKKEKKSGNIYDRESRYSSTGYDALRNFNLGDE